MQSALSTVLTRNKSLGQQISINVGINTLATTNPDDYAWNALGAVTGTLGSHGVIKGSSYFISPTLNKVIVPLASGYAGEYLGDSERLKSQYNIENKKHEK